MEMVTTRAVSGNTFGNDAKVLLGNITHNITTINSDTSAADNIFLQEISETNPVDDKKRILESKGSLIYESYCWILQHEDFVQWRDIQTNGVFWIKGDPGKGKTMLLCGIIEDFEKDFKPQEKLAYFFCQGTDTRLNTATAIIKGLIYSVLRQNQNLLSYIQKQVEKEPKGYLEGTNAWVALNRIFTTIIQDPCMADFTFIIDALDECQHQESRKSLLNLIMDTSNHVKWLISSRNEKEIERGLKSIENRLILELKSNAAHVSNAVDTYIDRCARDIEALENDVNLRNRTINLLKIKAKGTFLWVTLVVQQLRDAGRPHIETVLEEMPEGLESLYDEIMERSKKGWKHDKEACLAFLATVTVAERPLRIDELYIFTSSQLISSKVRYLPNDIEYLAKACGSFITITDNTIYLIHQSVKDYMMQKGAMSIFPRGIEYQHSKMIEISLNIMDNILRNNIYSIKLPGEHVDDITAPDPNPLASKAYCCAFWVEHLAHCSQPQLFQDGGRLHSFLREKCLYWLEAMVLLKLFPQAVTAIQKLRDLIANRCIVEDNNNQTSKSPHSRKRKRDSVRHDDQWLANTVMSEMNTDILITDERNETLELTKDVYRLVFSHRAIIEAFPLQIYASGLAFSPSESILRRFFECPEWIVAKPATRPTWSPCIQTIEGYKNTVSSVAISSDNTMLAAVATDEMAKIWDLISGVCLRTFETEHVEKVDFSPNNNQLALFTSEKFEIWDPITGTCLKTMNGRFDSVSFSADGTHLALVNKRIIKIHNLATGVDLQTHTSQAYEIFRAVIFPSDCAQLEAGCSDDAVGPRSMRTDTGALMLTDRTFHATAIASVWGTSIIKVLDLATGKYIQTIDTSPGRDSVRWMEVALSPDGMRLASTGSDKNIISIWDLATGKWLQTLKNDSVRNFSETVVFSADGLRLASPKDGEIKIWDIVTGTCLQTFSGHQTYVASLAFSPDGLQLVSGAGDHTIKVWDLAADSSSQLLQDQIDSMALSPDGKRVALGLGGETVRIWDTATRTFLQTMKVPDGSYVIVYSPDSKQLATAGSGRITIWNAATGASLRALTDYAGAADLIAFSPSNSQLASRTGFKYLKIWDLTAGTCLHTIKLDYPFASTIAFSPGGTQLGCISHEGTIKIWDPFTGICLQTLEDCYLIEWKDWEVRSHIVMENLFASFSEEQHLYYNYTMPDLELSNDRTWILKRKKRVLWLPPDYRPVLLATHNNVLAIVTRFHEFLPLVFSFDDLDI